MKDLPSEANQRISRNSTLLYDTLYKKAGKDAIEIIVFRPYWQALVSVLCAGIGWSAEVHPPAHPVNELQIDVVVGADGRRNTLPGNDMHSTNLNAITLLDSSSIVQFIAVYV